MNWGIISLDNACEVTSSKRVMSKNRTDCGIPFYCSKEIIQLAKQEPVSDSEYISEKLYEEIVSKFGGISSNDILLTTRGTLGVPYLVKENDIFYFGDGNLTWLRNFQDEVNSSYIYYYLLLKYNQNFYCSAATTIPFLTINYIKQIKIPLPSRKEQDRIVSILANYDALIVINRKKIVILEEMVMRIYREWFVHFRFPEYESCEFESDLPKGWKLAPISDLIENYIGGGWGEESQSRDFSIGSYVIRGSDIPNVLNGIPNKELFRYHTPSNIASRELSEGDIVFEISGGSDNQPLGRNCLITKSLLKTYGDKVICASFCKRLIPKRDYSEYLFGYLHQLWNVGALDAYSVRITGISNFKFEAFLKYHSVLMPPKEIVKKYSEIVNPIYNEVCKIGNSIDKLQKMRDRLLYQLLNGQLEISC